MPNRSRSPKADPNEAAHHAVNTLLSRFEVKAPKPKAKRKNPAAVALGRKGGLKGGYARAAKLTAKERSESAQKAARARWDRQESV